MLPAATPRIALRPMTRSDLRQVQRIEREAYGDAWPQTTFEQELNNGLAHYFVAVELPPERTASATRPPPGFLSPFRWLASLGRTRDPLLGFAGLWYTVDQLHLVTIAVAARHQHRGIARRMLLHCFALAEEAGLPSIALEVRASNERAIRLYEYSRHQASSSAGVFWYASSWTMLSAPPPGFSMRSGNEPSVATSAASSSSSARCATQSRSVQPSAGLGRSQRSASS